jgi:hypothetical protein
MRLPKAIVASGTGAAQSSEYHVDDDKQVTIFAVPILAGVEEAEIELTNDGGTTWVATGQKLTATVNILQLEGPASFRINKDATTSATAIHMFAT